MKLHIRRVSLSVFGAHWLATCRALAGLAMLIFCGTGFGATFTVNSVLDATVGSATNCTISSCQLRDAIAAANATSGAIIQFDPKVFASPKTITLSNASEFSIGRNPTIEISSSMTIQGPSPQLLTISGADQQRIFLINTSGDVSISGLTIAHGHCSDAGLGLGCGGGAIQISQANVDFDDVVLSENTAGDGFFYSGTGGAIYVGVGTVFFNHCAILNNRAREAILDSARGAGVAISSQSVATVVNSTISGNTTVDIEGFGAGVYVAGAFVGSNGSLIPGGVATFINSTIAGNISNDRNGGAGIFIDTGAYDSISDTNSPGGSVAMINSTVSANIATRGSSGGILVNVAGNLSLANTIIDGNSAPIAPDVPVAFVDQGGNLIGSNDSNLAPLAFNGGLTQTMLPAQTSAAICHAYLNNIPSGISTDQRGSPRVGPGNCVDSGAVQTQYYLGGFVSIPPSRLLDTRTNGTTVDGQFAATGSIGAGQILNLTVTGRGNVPVSNVFAVAINLTATDPTASGYLTAWPAMQPLPLSSNINFIAGQTVSNLIVAPVGAGGMISVFNSAGLTDVVGDVVGYFCAGSNLSATSPKRLLDTRRSGQTFDGQFESTGPLTAGATLDLAVSNRGGIPSAGAGAALLNLTATNTTAVGYITLFASGAMQPLASNLNFLPAHTVANLAIVPIGGDGKVSLFNSAGNTDLIADLIGWVPLQSQLNAIPPARLLDTRAGTFTIDGQFAGGGALPAGGSIRLIVAGRGGLPATGADSVVLNVTATNPSATGSITVWPTFAPQPFAPNLNFVPNATVPNLVISKLGLDGTVSLFNSAGTTDLVVDAVGWFSISP